MIDGRARLLAAGEQQWFHTCRELIRQQTAETAGTSGSLLQPHHAVIVAALMIDAFLRWTVGRIVPGCLWFDPVVPTLQIGAR